MASKKENIEQKNNLITYSTETTDFSEKVMPTCGIIMPISEIDGCSEQHWIDVKTILYDTIKNAGFEPNLVSYADDVGIIQKRIVQNIYDNPIVVCDVSGKNPNVMFELGLRLAFDKPVIIVKDSATSYSFDTSPIEHISYPRDLRFNKIVEFKKELAEKIKATYNKANSDSDFSPFLKHFGKFTIAKLDTQEVSESQYILEELRYLREIVNRNNRYMRKYNTPSLFDENDGKPITICLKDIRQEDIDANIIDKISSLDGVNFIENEDVDDDNHWHIIVHYTEKVSRKYLVNEISNIVNKYGARYVR